MSRVPKILFALLAVTRLTGCATFETTDNGAAGTIRVTTWNLEHLAAENGQGCRPRSDADYVNLRDHAERLDADVIAFQEVENTTAAERVFPSEGWTVVMSGRPDSGRQSPCGGGASQQIRKQDVGFAIRKGVRFRRNADLSALGLSDPDLRWGVDITLDLPKPIRLLAVHLKSGCNARHDPADADCDILFAQAPVLEAWIDARARAGEDFAVLGDWNRRTALANDEFLAAVSDDDPPAGRLVFTNAGRRASCVQRYPDFIDHVAFGRDAAQRIRPGSFVEYTYGVPEDEHPSDHCPNSVVISANSARR